MNPHTGDDIEIVRHRRMPPNMIIGLRKPAPFAHSRIGESLDLAMAREYYQIDYPMSTDSGRVFPVGCYVNQVLRLYSGLGSFVLMNVKAT